MTTKDAFRYWDKTSSNCLIKHISHGPEKVLVNPALHNIYIPSSPFQSLSTLASTQLKTRLALQVKQADLSAQVHEVELQAGQMSQVMGMVQQVQTEKRDLEVQVARLQSEVKEEKAKADFAYAQQVQNSNSCCSFSQ